MSLIEGIGDEVTIGFGILFLMCLVLLAWFSTHTRDIPFVSIIVVELSQRRHLSSRNRSNASGELTSSTGDSQASEDSHQIGEGDAVRNSSQTSSDQSSVLSEATPTHTDGEQSVDKGAASKDKSGAASNMDHLENESGVSSENKQTSKPVSSQDGSDNTSTISSPGAESGASPVKPEARSPDEVRKMRVAYFESARKKEYAGSIEDVPENSAASGSAESSIDKSASDTYEGSENSEETSLAMESGQSDNPETAEPQSHENQGAYPAPDSQQIRVRLKYLNDTQRLVYASPQETIGNFRRTHFSAELGENKVVRFIFNGQDLRNDLWTLGAYNISDNSVIHCLITQSQQQQDASNATAALGEDDLEIGVFIYPIFGLILGVLWYFRFSYKQYFNAVSTVSLAGVSFIYCLALVSSLRGRRRPHQHLD